MAFDRFTEVVYTEKIGDTPAAVNRRTGVLYINPVQFGKYPEHWQKFILLHELGHLVLQTKNELAADDFAFRHYVRGGGSLKESVLSLSEILDVDNNKSHYIRAKEQLKRAQEWDARVNGKTIGKISKQQAMCNTKEHKNKHTQLLVACIQNGDVNGAREQVDELLMHADPSERNKLMSKFNEIINNMDEAKDDSIGTQFLSAYNDTSNYYPGDNYLTGYRGVERIIANYKGEEVVNTAGAAAGAVANLIVPGSGVLVNKIVSGGGKIVSGIVGFFQKKKAEGKSDAQILNDPEYLAQKAQAQAELEQLYEDNANFQAKYQQYLGAFTDADRTFSTMRKKAKITKAVLPGAGKIDGDTFSYGGYTLQLSQLNVFKPVFGLGEGVAMPTWQTTPVTPKSTATGLPDPAASGAEQPKKKPKTGLILGIVAAIIIIAAVVAFIMLRKKKS